MSPGALASEPATAGGRDAAALLLRYFGSGFFAEIQGKTVIDFGCGPGREAVAMAAAMARHGAGRVIALDIQERFLAQGRELAERSGVADRCSFATSTTEKADIIVSKDAFEHFDDPAAILRIMRGLLKPDGHVLAAFGPTWLHPHGGHLFSVFPWSHLVFTENALIRWRADFKSDGARRFREVDGGLNQLTIRRFEQIAAASPLSFAALDTVPIKGQGWLKSSLLREFGSALVRCKLVPRQPG